MSTAPVVPSGELEAKKASLIEAIKPNLSAIPLLSIQMLPAWDYTPIAMVTAQSVTGTGLFADVSSVFTDAFGIQSGSFKKKLQHGEHLCRNGLRLDAIKLGAHAVIGVDVDYADVGGVKSMLMVCMTGTAIRLNKTDVLSTDAQTRISEAHRLASELRQLRG